MERWTELFADLEAQWAAGETAELEGEVLDRARVEQAAVSWMQRLAAALGEELTVRVGGCALVGQVTAVGADWLVLTVPPAAEVLVPAGAVEGIVGLGAAALLDAGAPDVERRLPFASALRGLARRRAPVQVEVADGSVVHGTIDRVGADYFDLAEHPAGEWRRAGAVRALRMVPLAAVRLVRSG